MSERRKTPLDSGNASPYINQAGRRFGLPFGVFQMPAPFKPSMLKPADMNLADDVQLFEGAYGVGVVTQIDDEIVHIFRPYMATSDFSYGERAAQVVPYIGHEIVRLWVTGSREYLVLQRKELK